MNTTNRRPERWHHTGATCRMVRRGLVGLGAVTTLVVGRVVGSVVGAPSAGGSTPAGAGASAAASSAVGIAASPAGSSGGSSGGDASLAFTGAQTWMLARAGVALALLGAAVLRARRLLRPARQL